MYIFPLFPKSGNALIGILDQVFMRQSHGWPVINRKKRNSKPTLTTDTEIGSGPA